MNNLLKEFQQFALRGNIVDLAVGIVIGTAFGKIVTSLVSDIIMPLVGILVGGINFSDLKVILKPETIDATGNTIPAVVLSYGNFLQSAFDFLIVAICIFIAIQIISSLKKKNQKEVQKQPPMNKEEQLLTEIRDLLKKQQA